MRMFNLLNESTINCIVNEAYYGKTRGIQKLRAAFQDVYNMAIQDLSVRNDNSKEFKYFSKCIEEEFGFKRVVFSVTAEAFINAYTYPVIVKRAPKLTPPITETPNGIKFSKDTNYTTAIYVTGAMMKSLTPDEIFAIILHEIGHSFSALVYAEYSNSIFDRFTSFTSNMLASIMEDAKSDIVKRYDSIDIDDNARKIAEDEYRKSVEYNNSKLAKFINTSKTIIALGFEIFGLLSTFDSKAIITAGYLAYHACNINKNFRTHGTNTNLDNRTGNEYFSDSFAAMYGYAVEIPTALGKLEGDYSRGYNIGAIANGISKLTSLVNSSHVHPDTYQRAMSLRAHITQEIEKNKLLDKKTKKELEQQVIQLSKVIEDLSNPKNYNVFSNLYNKVILLKKNRTQKTVDNIDYSFGLNRG